MEIRLTSCKLDLISVRSVAIRVARLQPGTGNDEMRSIMKFGEQRRKSGISYGWFFQNARKRKVKLNFVGTLIKYFKLYGKYTSLTGFKYIVQDRGSWIEKVLWILVYAVTLCILVFLILSGYHDFIEVPIVTTVDSEYFPTNELEFPGVAICTVNRMSLQSVREFATEIFNANISDLSVDEIMPLVLGLGDLYDSAVMIDDQYTGTAETLKKFYNGSYNIDEIAKRLTPQCADMLLVCYFHGEKRNCTDIFELRKTQDGFCCTFNYAGKPDDIYESEDSKEGYTPVKIHLVDDLGVTAGLTVVMEPNLDDYFYTILPTTGWKVTIFNPRDFPDMTSGGVSEILVTPQTERYVELDAVRLYSTDDIKSFPAKKRGCVFPSERMSKTTYTYSDCIVQCKADDMWKVCKCRPFYFPRRSKAEHSQKVCDVDDIPCLERNKYRWFYVIPYEHVEMRDDSENDTAPVLRCETCYPQCEDVSYITKTAMSFIDGGTFETPLLGGLDVVNQSIVHIFFTRLGTMNLKQDVIYRWYEFMSDVGGICGVFIGFSLISVVEFIYLTILFVFDLFSRDPPASQTTRKDHDRSDRLIHTIYWGELIPRSRNLYEIWRLEKKNENLT